jgi:hypothetical protein
MPTLDNKVKEWNMISEKVTNLRNAYHLDNTKSILLGTCKSV